MAVRGYYIHLCASAVMVGKTWGSDDLKLFPAVPGDGLG